MHGRRGRRLKNPPPPSATALAERAYRPSLLRHRIFTFGGAAIAFTLCMLLAPPWLTGGTRIVAGYDTAIFLLIVTLWLTVMRRDARDTACRAALEDPGRNVVLGVVLAAVAIGLGAAIWIIGGTHHLDRPAEVAIVYASGLGAVSLGWFLIHTIFVFRYAHLFYFDSNDDGSAQRGLIFPGTENPNDYDFAYYSFVVGMTFQVSDVQITDPGVRRLTLLHALISFGYNTTIVALVINLISSIIHS
ncbi:MAG: DUF1345 domain-containing protein [Candidatus Velthaea sp.]